MIREFKFSMFLMSILELRHLLTADGRPHCGGHLPLTNRICGLLKAVNKLLDYGGSGFIKNACMLNIFAWCDDLIHTWVLLN